MPTHKLAPLMNDIKWEILVLTANFVTIRLGESFSLFRSSLELLPGSPTTNKADRLAGCQKKFTCWVGGFSVRIPYRMEPTRSGKASANSMFDRPEPRCDSSALLRRELFSAISTIFLGLGTSTSKEAKEYFADMIRHRVRFKYSGPDDDGCIDMVGKLFIL